MGKYADAKSSEEVRVLKNEEDRVIEQGESGRIE